MGFSELSTHHLGKASYSSLPIVSSTIYKRYEKRLAILYTYSTSLRNRQVHRERGNDRIKR